MLLPVTGPHWLLQREHRHQLPWAPLQLLLLLLHGLLLVVLLPHSPALGCN